MANQITVIGPQFLASYPVNLTFTEKFMTANSTITDVDGSIIFKIKCSTFSLHNTHLLLDAAGTPILTMREEIFSVHDRWHVYRGESKDDNDLLFSVEKPSKSRLKNKLVVYLASNATENVCDFHVERGWPRKSCAVYLGDSTNTIAEMHKRHGFHLKDTFKVTVNPHVDQAFIVALSMIVDEINTVRRANSSGQTHHGGGDSTFGMTGSMGMASTHHCT